MAVNKIRGSRKFRQGRRPDFFILLILYDFLVTVKAAPHVCVIRTGLP